MRGEDPRAESGVHKRHAVQRQSQHRPPSRLRQQHHQGYVLLLKGEAGSWRSLRHDDGGRFKSFAHADENKLTRTTAGQPVLWT